MQPLQNKLKALRLSGMAEVLDVRNHEAVVAKLSYVEFLELLIEDELCRRQSRLYERRTQKARFPTIKTLATFDFDFNTNINRRQIADLATCRFVPSAETILLMGPPGVGKSHLAIALGEKAVKAGYTVRYFAADALAASLAEADASEKLPSLLEELARAELLIIDDLGLKPLPPAAGAYFLDVIRQAYEKSAVIVTCNRPFDDWGAILSDNTIATAILDRLLHHAHTIQITGKSYRVHNRKTPSSDPSFVPPPKPKHRGRKQPHRF